MPGRCRLIFFQAYGPQVSDENGIFNMSKYFIVLRLGIANYPGQFVAVRRGNDLHDLLPVGGLDHELEAGLIMLANIVGNADELIGGYAGIFIIGIRKKDDDFVVG